MSAQNTYGQLSSEDISSHKHACTEENSDLFTKVHSWAYANFQAQAVLHKCECPISEKVLLQLQHIGYAPLSSTSLSDAQRSILCEAEAFFGYMHTGRRIVAFALTENGLNRDKFEHIEKSITHAYEKIIQEEGADRLIEATYQYSLQTLAVFKP